MSLPPRKSPRIETAASRGPYRYHEPIDNSCESLEQEVLPFGCGGWQSDLLNDMRCRDSRYLGLHYPELTFATVRGKKPGGHDYVVEMGGSRYRVADWRTCPQGSVSGPSGREP